MSPSPPALPELLFVRMSEDSYLLCEKLSLVRTEELDAAVLPKLDELFRSSGGPFEVCEIPSDYLYEEKGVLFMQARYPVPRPPRP